MERKVITLQQPWAYLVCRGIKGIETRSWPTQYTGELLIHAAKRMDLWDTEFMELWPWAEVLTYEEIRQLQYGAIIGKVTLKDCRKTEDLAGTITKLEEALGDYRPKRFAWILDDPVLFPEPIPCDGKLGIWTIDLDQPLTYEQAKEQKNRMVRKMLWLGYQMGYDNPRGPEQELMSRSKRCWTNVEAWCMSKRCSINKPISKYTVEELAKVVTQFEQVYKSFLNG